VADEWGGCLPDPLPPELAELLAIQEQVYSAVFATPYDPCRDGGLLLDRPIAGVLDQVTGRNSVGEVFEFVVVEYWRMTEGTREGGAGARNRE